MPERTKQEILNEIAAVCDTPVRQVARGSTEPKVVFVDIIERFSLAISASLEKPLLAERIAMAGDEPWQPFYDSRNTPSRGGGTVTRLGLEAVLLAVKRLAGQIDPIAAPSQDETVGSDYQPANEDVAEERDPFLVDPDAFDRANAAHRTTQNSVAAWAEERGFEPISPRPGEPQFDVGWRSGQAIYIVEVKSLLSVRENGQLRLGLGQVLDYRATLSMTKNIPVQVGLVTSRPPSSPRWEPLLLAHDVGLAWPGEFERLLNGREPSRCGA